MIKSNLQVFLVLFLAGNLLFASPVVSQALSPQSDYTEDDCNRSLEAFDHHYYDTKRNIYSAGYNQTGTAAIWTQAIYFDIIQNAWKRTRSEAWRTRIDDFYQGAYNQYNRFNWAVTDYPNGWFIYDDIMWWVIATARAYRLTGEDKYLKIAQSGFQRVWSGSPEVGDKGAYDPAGGGMYWAWNNQNPVGSPQPNMGKMACINYPTVIGAMTLYQITGETGYLDKAKEIYAWARKNLLDTKKGRVADSKHGNGKPDWTLHLYNQATCIGAAVMLYRETGERYYLEDAVLVADYTKNQMCTDGFLPFETGIEQGIYTAIFAQYMIRLIEDCGQDQYLPWLRYNINAGWANRRPDTGITWKNHAQPAPALHTIESYDASTIPALMQVIPPLEKTAK